MSPLLASFLASILRHALTGASVYFVTHGYFSQGDAANYVAAFITFLLGLGWSLWQKYGSRIAFLTALQLPAGSSEEQVTAKIQSGQGAPLVPLVLAIVLASLSMTACASMPAKQKAAISLQAIETGLGSAQDFERANYTAMGETVVASASLRKYCPASALGQSLPANATVHQVVSCLFVQAFASQAASSKALQTWQAGTAPPTVLGELRGEVDTLFAVVKGFSANTNQQQLLTLAQNTVDSVLSVVNLMGGNVPSVTPGGGQ